MMNDANHPTTSSAKAWTENWKLVQQLHSGAQGVAMKVANETVGLAFLKVLKEQGQGDSERRARMYREVAALRTINVPEIPRLIETNADHHEDPSYGLYLVTEFVEGPNLQKAVETNRISAALAVEFAISLAKTLSNAHGHGISHRDVKPDNVIISSRGSDLVPVLVDFGMASLDEVHDDLTAASQEIGNRFLRLPEFSPGSSDKRDIRSDITFCVGLFFFMLTKRHPRILIDGSSRMPQQRDNGGDILAASALNLDRLLVIFERGFQQDLSRRYQTTDDFLRDLERLKQIATTNDSPTNPPLESVLERLETANERNRVNNIEAMTLALRSATAVVREVVSQSRGLLGQKQTGFQQKPSAVTDCQMIYTITDESKVFSAFFAATINGSEVVLTIDSAGLRRFRLRIPLGQEISPDEKARVRQFITAGIDIATDPEKKAAAEVMCRETERAAMAQADLILRSLSETIVKFISSPHSSGLTVFGSVSSGRAASKKVGEIIIGQSTVTTRSRHSEWYVRFNCMVSVVPAKHIDNVDDMWSRQEITLTGSAKESESGVQATLSRSRVGPESFSPSVEELSDALARVMTS